MKHVWYNVLRVVAETASCPFQMAVGGVAAAVCGKWTMSVGTRFAMASGAAFFGSGFFTTAMGIAQHNLPLLYTGNGNKSCP